MFADFDHRPAAHRKSIGSPIKPETDFNEKQHNTQQQVNNIQTTETARAGPSYHHQHQHHHHHTSLH